MFNAFIMSGDVRQGLGHFRRSVNQLFEDSSRFAYPSAWTGTDQNTAKRMITLLGRIRSQFAQEWCRLMHPDPKWPIHGYYECPQCRRRYQVPWEVQPRQVLRCETGCRPLPIPGNSAVSDAPSR